MVTNETPKTQQKVQKSNEVNEKQLNFLNDKKVPEVSFLSKKILELI